MSIDPKERCLECGHRTRFGQEEDKKRARRSPIFGTNFDEPLSAIIEEVRNRMVAARGTLHDIASATGWGERVDDVAGLLTCAIHVLHDVKEEMKKIEDK